MHIGLSAGLLDVGVVGIRSRQPDVLADRVPGEERELGEFGDLVTQRRDGHSDDVVAVEQDPPLLRIQEPQQEVEHRRFTRPDTADQCHGLAF